MIEVVKNNADNENYLLIIRLKDGTKMRILYRSIELLIIELDSIMEYEKYNKHSIEIKNITDKLSKYIYLNDSIITKLKDTNKSQLSKSSGLNRSLLFAILNYEINFLSKNNYDKLVSNL